MCSWVLLVAAGVATVLAGCSDMGTPPRRFALPELSATSLDFGTVALSDSALRAVTLSNTGTADLTGTAAVTCSEFQLQSGGGAFSIPPGGSLTVVLKFAPGGVGTFPCTLELGPNSPAVSIVGAGALQAVGAAGLAAPDSLDFGSLQAGDSATRSFRVFSVGTAPLLVNVVSTCDEFIVLSGGGPTTLASATSINVTVQFSPRSSGAHPCAVLVGPGITDVAVTGFATTISFANDVQPIFQNWCINCHEFTKSYNSLMTWPSAYPAPNKIIVPFDPAHSVLYGKITNSGQFGRLMPQGGPLLPQHDRDVIRDWILEGARDN